MQITVFGKDVPNPIETFEEAQFPKYLMNVIRERNFAAPTAIQSQGSS